MEQDRLYEADVEASAQWCADRFMDWFAAEFPERLAPSEMAKLRAATRQCAGSWLRNGTYIFGYHFISKKASAAAPLTFPLVKDSLASS